MSKKRGIVSVDEHIEALSKKGYSKAKIKEYLVKLGYDESYLDKKFYGIKNRKRILYSAYAIFVFIFIISLFFTEPSLTGLVISENSGQNLEGLRYASADYNSETGLIYQGLAQDNTEKIIGASVQGKQRGSVNIIDYDNSGKGSLFTTGFYTKNGEEIASTDLYKYFNRKIGSFTDVKYSDSAWCDFDNDGYLDVAIIGESKDGVKFEVYKNDKGSFNPPQSFDGFSLGSVRCADFNNDGWDDLIVTGKSITKNLIPENKLLFFKNNKGSLELKNEDSGFRDSSLEVNDFNNDGKFDFIISGLKGTNLETDLFTNDGNSFSPKKIIENQIRNPSIASGDYNNDGNIDFGIIGSEGFIVKSTLFKNNNGEFIAENLSLPGVSIGSILLYKENLKNNLNIFIIGLNSDAIHYTANIFYLSPPTPNTPPTPPTSLNYSKLENNYIKFTWSPSTDKETKYLFYHVKVGDDSNEDKYLSGFLSNKFGNAGLNLFKILKSPCQNKIDEFFFQVKAIDGAYAQSAWSEKLYISCNNRLLNNITLPEIIDEANQWRDNKEFGKIKYEAFYQREENYVSVTEKITNTDAYAHENVIFEHTDNGEIIYGKGYNNNGKKYTAYIGRLGPGETKLLYLKLKSEIKSGYLMQTQAYSIRFIPEKSVKIELPKPNITVEKNKTIIEVETNPNKTIAKDVQVIQKIPKCLLEKINEMAVKSGILKSNKNFRILQEDPIVMWEFEDIVDAQKLKLEITNIADKNCTDQIQTEVIAKKVLANYDQGSLAVAFMEFIIPLMLIIWFFLSLDDWKKRFETSENIRRRRQIYRLVFILSAVLLIYNICDALSILPPTLDFIKKMMSWTGMIIFFIYLNVSDVLAGAKDNKAKKWFNFFLLAGYIFLSIKNMVFAAFETYGEEQLFHDLALLIIKNSRMIEVGFFSGGILCMAIAIIIAWTKFELSDSSLADLFGRREEFFIGARLQKLFFIAILVGGFFISIFSFFFDWFSVGVDSPFLIFVCLLSLREVNIVASEEKPDSLLKTYVNLFKHKKNRHLAICSIPIFIFIVECYTYLAYFVFGIRNMYIASLPYAIPDLMDIINKYSYTMQLVPYIIQILGLIAAAYLSFRFWYHFFIEGVKEKPASADKPEHPIAFSLLIAGAYSFIINPIFTVNAIATSRISGLVIQYQFINQASLFTAWITVLIILASWLIFKFAKPKFLTALAYSIILTVIFYFTSMFTKGMLLMTQHNFAGLGNLNIYAYINAIFFAGLSIIFMLIMLSSYFYLIAEFFSLLEEEYGHLKHYRIILRKLFGHKVKTTKEHIEEIKKEYSKAVPKGLEKYHIIELIESKTGLTPKEIAFVLSEIETDEEKKARFRNLHIMLHNPQNLEKLHAYIKDLYWKRNMPIEKIIEHCLNYNYTEDDIAAACLHMRHRKKDKIIFREMKKELYPVS